MGGVALGLLLLAVPQMYGVGYPVMYKAMAGSYALWFLIVLVLTKMIATSLTIGIGGSGGVFAPSLFIGATAGMAFGVVVDHLVGPGAGQPALYAVVAMGAVFASAARAPLTSLASVVEMTGDYTLTLPVMLAVAIATVVSRALSYGTIYTTKLLRRGTDIDQAPSADPFEDLTAADAIRAFQPPLTAEPGLPGSPSSPGEDGASLPGPVTHQGAPQVLFANEPLAQARAPAGALRPRRAAGTVHGRGTTGGLGHQRERAAGHRPPHRRRSRRCRRQTHLAEGWALPNPPAAGDAHQSPSRLPDPGSDHRRGLAHGRAYAGRNQLATRLRTGVGPGQPHAERPRPRHHPRLRRPRQPARPCAPGPRPKASPTSPGAPPGPAREAPAPPTGEQP